MQPNIRPQIMLNWVETVAATVYSQIKFVRRDAISSWKFTRVHIQIKAQKVIYEGV